jgi:hypothetical protein
MTIVAATFDLAATAYLDIATGTITTGGNSNNFEQGLYIDGLDRTDIYPRKRRPLP